jgi:hypothetical protein
MAPVVTVSYRGIKVMAPVVTVSYRGIKVMTFVVTSVLHGIKGDVTVCYRSLTRG